MSERPHFHARGREAAAGEGACERRVCVLALSWARLVSRGTPSGGEENFCGSYRPPGVVGL
jgi:hypothetical protein